MIRVALGVLVLLACGAVRAEDGGRPNVDIVVPVPPYEHERLHYFGRRDHHLVPGTVTINADPYVCDLDKKHFRDRDHFVDHLRRAHHVEPDRIPDRLQVLDGQVHFLND